MRIALLLSLLATTSGSTLAAEEAQLEFFEKRIRPVLAKHCYECHSEDGKSIKGGLRVDTRNGMLEGGESGESIVLGEPAESLLISALKYESFEMPPTGKLPENVIRDFEKWVEMGAPDPRRSGPDEGNVDRLGGVAASDLWSLRPLERPTALAVSDESWPRTTIDRFILARLEAAELGPVGDADRATLLRRVCFDLVGLPPTPERIEAFTRDDSPQAFEHVVDELLASPRFGERWGRHWLDVARYAESNGKSRDVLMPHAWRYRNWVVDALNADLPYDEFVTQQIAGDLLPADSVEQRDRQRIATGFLAIGSKPLVGGNLVMDLVDDQIDVTSKAFLGLTASCARCHDHKFDPIPTRDYYALAGVFLSTETRFGGGMRKPKNDAERAGYLIALGDDVDRRVEALKASTKQVEQLTKRRNAASKKLQQLQKRKNAPEDQLAMAKATLAGIDEELKTARAASQGSELEYACGVVEAAEPRNCRIHVRGEKGSQGAVVPRGFLSCIEAVETAEVEPEASGRLELARFITHAANPLTPRVAANRVWQHLFGRGLVTTVDNFGVNGAQPTHPELLDHVAGRLVDNGWSIKQLIREIVLSRTYQLSGQLDEANHAVDPGNELYWRTSRRRLEAEALRDAMLAASGQLNLERPVASPVAEIGEGEVGRGIDLKPLKAAFSHRSVYLPIIRGIVPEFLATFDFPEPSNVQGQRVATNVPTQSLYLLNSPFVLEQSAHLADRVLEKGDDEMIRSAYRLVLSREPSDVEFSRTTDFLSEHAASLSGEDARREAVVSFCQALFASAEFRFVD